MKLRRYDKYIDSGVEWLGDIPKDWEIDRLKNLAIISTGNKNSEDYNLDGDYPFFVRSKSILRINSYTFDEEAILTAGDGDIGKIFHYINGKFDAHQRVYCIRKFKNYYGKFLFYYLSTKLYNEAKINNFNSIVNSIRLPLFRNFKTVTPSLQEQTQIAQYLDAKTQAIDKKVTLLEQKIKTYQELKIALINEIVTKGLDKSVQLKNSGIDWIGEIPEHWEIKRAKEVFIESDKKSIKGEEELLSVSEYYGVGKRSDKFEEHQANSRAKTLEGYKICEVNDLVINIMLAWKGSLGISKYRGIVSPAYSVFKPINIHSQYFHYLFRTDLYKDIFMVNSKGIIWSRLRLYPDKFYTIDVITPPKQEQQKIADYLDEKTQKIEAIIQNIEQQITTLKEYRKTLINDVVTGKIKVTD